jgi:hypothetical protein
MPHAYGESQTFSNPINALGIRAKRRDAFALGQV